MPPDAVTQLPATSPDRPLDVLVAGGGPCGTAVAFRASELRMSVFVLELDDLLKRIRDYGKEKQILPSHGGGADLRFPAGGEFIAQLEFEPIDKDDMCARWKGFYARNKVLFATGTELTGLARTGEVWTARVWGQRDRTEHQVHARHVVLALGRGVPRRFDIPGNVEGIAFKLDDPQHYVGGPACVVGGGTSAAEAVIAISNAKAKADDASTVHWCYRGEKMPLVAQALAEAFFKAHLLNGNIRLQPNSDPSAIVVGADKSEYFAIRTDRRVIAGRPAESTHLEFPKRQCIACIGEDIPEAFLKSLGIPMVVGGPKARKQMVVSRLHESRLENVYLGGAILSPNYLVADAMDGDPATFTEVDRRDNIKLGLYDGVAIAEVIRQRLDGVARKDIQVSVRESAAVARASNGGAPEVVPAADVDEAPSPGRLRRLAPDGVQVDEYRLKPSGVTTIGRKGCDIVLPEDTTLADDHASISVGPDGWTLRDDGSAGGVYFKVPQARWVDLSTPAIVRAGRQFLRFVDHDKAHVMIHYDLNGNELGRHTLPARAIVIGRDSPDVILDPADKSLSRRHIGVTLENDAVRLMDLHSMNGTYLKLTNGVRLESGDEFRIGNQRFVVELGASSQKPGQVEFERKVATGGTPAEVKAVAPVQPSKPSSAPPSGEPKVTIKSTGKTIAVKPGQSICEALEAAGIETRADCHAGACGSDPIQILEGIENLNACGERESRALDTFCQLEPGPFRLSCVAKPTGPVVIEIVST